MTLPARVVRAMDPFEAVQREFDTVLGRLFGGTANGGFLAPYAVDVREDGDRIIVEAELPGFTKDQIDVTLENSVLTISADRNEERSEQNAGDYLVRERRFTRFQRSFTLPPTVDESSVNAKLENGVLTVTLNKRPEAKPRKISVS
ncbi:MAG: Hsp20/alpha crystallin family protein [Tepidisphaerales bacterium]